MPQFKRLCELYNIKFQEPLPLTRENGWFSGFFDADGTIGFSMKNNWPQLIVSVTQKYQSDLLSFKSVFGGSIRLDTRTTTYKWDIYSQDDVLDFQKYLTVSFV
uniref:Putative site-specific DNA endonuclease n=1 Tax=Chaetophoropsis cf. attenuata FACHB-2291 TaxID=2725790 RepID=A0A6H1U7A4_9CHLO|nr:putative site-specific DNA endonuclease [Chaetophoropsis cf. attenuata FACHB-2291]